MVDKNDTIKKDAASGTSDKSKNQKKESPSTNQRSIMKPSTLLSFIAIVIAVLALIEGFFINSKIQKSDKAVTGFTQVLNTTVENQNNN